MRIALFSFGNTNSAVAQVVHAVPLAQESITHDGQRASGLREVHAHKGTHAVARDLQGVVKGADGEVVPTQVEGEVGQGLTLVAVNVVLTQEVLGGANLLVTIAGYISFQSNQLYFRVEEGNELTEGQPE